MQLEKLKLLEKLHYSGKNARVLLADGSTIIGIPWDWSYLENSVAYTVKLIEPVESCPAGFLFTIENEEIVSIDEL